MVSSKAPTVAEYLRELPAERRAVVGAMRRIILDNLPRGYVEAMNWGMIVYEVPLNVRPDTYNGMPLVYAGLAAQKHAYSLYLMPIYVGAAPLRMLLDGFKAMGVKPDMGKGCVRFTSLDKLPLDAIGKVIASTPMGEFIALHDKVHAQRHAGKRQAKKSTAAKKRGAGRAARR